MFLKELIISSEHRIIREIIFHKGINLIVDETGVQDTGNNVGKTTVLKLIDFCLGGNPRMIWVDPENQSSEYELIKSFLKDKKVLITLVLKEDLDIEDSLEVVIERNFLARKEIIRRINGSDFTEAEFEIELGKLIFPSLVSAQPTFRQLISHSIRHREETINNTLRTLDAYSSDAQYESLHLFMLGVDFSDGQSKQDLLNKLKQEETFKSRLERNQTKNAYETALAIIDGDIETLNNLKRSFNLNENFAEDLERLTTIKYRLNSASSELTGMRMRREIIKEAEQDLRSNIADIDLEQLRHVYEQATSQVSRIQKTFDDLVHYHNQMIEEKVKYITKELPSLDSIIERKRAMIDQLLGEEKRISETIAKSESFEELERLISEINEKFQKKGEYENIVSQINEVELEIKSLNEQLHEIETEQFSDIFEHKVKSQVNKFNKYFAAVSQELYGEQFALKYDIVSKKGKKLYKFTAFNLNFSSGKKQGEISCFDIAYILFADSENIPCLHFILNDKKELMHGNQLVKISEIVNRSNIQFIASILKDKLPPALDNEDYFVVKLSQSNKLFRI